MRQETSLFNKTLALLLCVFVMLSSVNLSLITFAAEENLADTTTVTEAELVADNYESLKSSEKAILKSGFLKSGTLSYPVPSSSEGLVTADPDTRTITVAPFEKDGYVWNPVSAAVVYADGRENVELSGGEGTFTYEGAAYTIEVVYELYIAVDAATQTALLNAPYIISRLYKNGKELDKHEADFNAISNNVDALVKLTDGSLPLGARINTEITINAINDLAAQVEKNDGFLDIEIMLFDYDDAASKIEYLLANGRQLKAEAEKLYEQIGYIYNDEGIAAILDLLGNNNSTARKVRVVLNSLNTLLQDLQEIIEDDWTMLDTNPLKDGMTAQEFVALDALAENAADAAYHDDEIKPELFADSVILTHNVNQHTVTVIVSAAVIKETSVDNATPTALEDHSVELRLVDGMDAAAVIAEIAASGIEQSALDAWGEISEENYDRTADELTGVLTSDLVYRIRYTPKMLTIMYDFTTDLPTSVPYGYNMTLPLHDGEAFVYDYTVNGQAYLQGEIVRITENTGIKRTEGKPWNVQLINKLVALSYADQLTAAEAAVLTAVALRSDYILLRAPDNDDNLVTVSVVENSGEGTDATETKYKVEAENYASGLAGLSWKAISGKAILGSEEVVATFVFNDGVAIFTAEPFDRVDVEYKLVLDGVVDEQKVLDALNLPGILAEQAADQKENLEILNGLYSKLGQLTRATLNQIKFGVGGSDMSEEAKAAVDAILNGCVDNDAAQLYLYTYLTEYRKTGLTYYYQDNNYLRIRNQVEILNANLSTIYNDPEFLPLLQDIEYEEYYDRIGDIIADLSRVNLSDPHEAINTASPSLAELVAAIEQISDPRTFLQANEELVLTKTLNAAAPQRAVITINVQAVNSVGDVIKSGSSTTAVSSTEPLTDADIDKLNGIIEGLVRLTAIDTVHYETADVLMITAGMTLQSNTTVTFTYTPKEYTVVFVDENGNKLESTTFKYDVPTIILPACEESGMQYRYTVCGTEVIVGSEAKSVTFTDEQIDSGEYAEIVRETIDVYHDSALDLAEKINEGAKDAGMVDGNSISMAMIPMEDADGNLVFVFRVSPKNLSKLSSFMTKTADALSSSDFTHIKLGEDFLREDSEISLQAAVNAVLNSGMSLDTILEAITADGHINEMTIPGVTVIGADANGNIQLSGGKVVPETDKLGGKIMETTVTLGTSENDTGITAKLYITIEDFGKSTDTLKNLRDLVKRVRNYGNITAHDGMIDVDITMPDRAYQAYISAMIALGNTSLHDLDDVNLMAAKDLALDIFTYLMADETITTETYENTLAKAHKDIELSKYQNYYSKARRALDHLLNNITIDPNTELATSNEYTGDINYDINALFNKLDLAETFRKMIKERDTGINFRIKVKINNNNDYDALVVDPGAKGTAKVVYTRDLAAALRSIHKNTAIVLLSDYDGDVTITKQTLLDLNGHKINGNLVCEAKTIIVDSRLETNSGAGVTGSVSGNAIITAGEYGSDVSSMIKSGYKFEGGKVVNGFYYIEVENDTVNVHFTPNAETIRELDKAGIKALGAEFIVDLALNYYMCASLKIGGNNIYTAEFNDIIRFVEGITAADVNEALDCIDCAGITALANDLLSKLTDLTALGEAVNAGTAAATYDVEYQPWTFDIEHIANGDYLTANVHPNANITNTQTINFFVDNNNDLGDLLIKLGEILTIDAEVELEDVYYDSSKKDIVIIGNGSIEATADLTGDPNYAVVIGVVLANGTKDNAKREALVEAIKLWCNSGYKMADLKAAIEAMTTEELLDAFDTNTSFEDMLAALGLDGIVTEEATELYNTYRRVIKATFKVIDRFGKFSGGSTKLGSFEKEYGVYSSEKTNKKVQRSFDVRGSYGVTGIATAQLVRLTVKIFVEDETFPIIVLNEEGEEIWHGSNLNEAFDQALDGYTIVVSGRVTLEADVELDREVKLEGGEYVDFGNFNIYLTDPDNSKFTIDLQITDKVLSDDEAYKVVETQEGNDFVYTLELAETYKIIVTKDDEVLYKGNELNKAFEKATDGSTITILDEVELTEDVELDREVTLVGAQFADFGDYKIILTSVEDSKLISDEKITDTVAPLDETYYVVETEDNGNYVYTLARYKVVVTNGDEILYKGDDINAAFDAATAGSTVTVYGEVALAADIELNREVELVGADLVTFGEYTFILTSEDAKLTSDKQITDYVESFDPTYYVVEEGNYVYTLVHYKIIVTNGDEILYKGDDLNAAFEAATDGSTITVYDEVVLAENVELDRKVEVVGGEYIDFNGKTVTLTDPAAELAIDLQITDTVKSGSEYSEVKETSENGTYVYTLEALTPEISDPTITKQDPILAYKIDNTNGIIILDILDPDSYEDAKLAGNGITVAQFKEALGFTYENADTTSITIMANGKTLGDNELVPTGTKVTVTATNPDYNGNVTKEYDVVILGDTNCNGRIDSGDAKLMLDHYFGGTELTGLRFIAGDTNCNGRIDSGDAVKNSVKYTRPKEYKSDLE